MSTDDIRDALHTAFERAGGGVTTDPTLLSVVRRRHARHQRRMMVGAPLGVAAVGVGALVGGAAIHHPDHGSTSNVVAADPTVEPTSSQPAATIQTVSLVGHDLSLPGDWTLSGNRRLIDLDSLPRDQVIGGMDQSVTATSPDGAQKFAATVYSGPIADAEGSADSAVDDPTFTHLMINGQEISILVSGPPTRCLSRSPSDGASVSLPHGPGSSWTEGPCPTSFADDAPYGEARYTFANGDFMEVDTNGMDAEALTSFLTTALSG